MGRSVEVRAEDKAAVLLLLGPQAPQEVLKEGAGEQGCMGNP